jgi:hypothetical protein
VPVVSPLGTLAVAAAFGHHVVSHALLFVVSQQT